MYDEMMAEKRGFVVLSEEGDESGEIEILDEHFGSGNLQKDWEVNISLSFSKIQNGSRFFLGGLMS
jgi:hypothetical protein